VSGIAHLRAAIPLSAKFAGMERNPITYFGMTLPAWTGTSITLKDLCSAIHLFSGYHPDPNEEYAPRL
jgi:hypothetical protein